MGVETSEKACQEIVRETDCKNVDTVEEIQIKGTN